MVPRQGTVLAERSVTGRRCSQGDGTLESSNAAQLRQRASKRTVEVLLWLQIVSNVDW